MKYTGVVAKHHGGDPSSYEDKGLLELAEEVSASARATTFHIHCVRHLRKIVDDPTNLDKSAESLEKHCANFMDVPSGSILRSILVRRFSLWRAPVSSPGPGGANGFPKGAIGRQTDSVPRGAWKPWGADGFPKGSWGALGVPRNQVSRGLAVAFPWCRLICSSLFYATAP